MSLPLLRAPSLVPRDPDRYLHRPTYSAAIPEDPASRTSSISQRALVSMAASKLGDQHTGCAGSQGWPFYTHVFAGFCGLWPQAPPPSLLGNSRRLLPHPKSGDGDRGEGPAWGWSSHYRIQSGSNVCQSLYEPSVQEGSVRLQGAISLVVPISSQKQFRGPWVT